MLRPTSWIAAALTLALVLTGCGGSGLGGPEKRELPREASLKARQTLDMCALAPEAELKKEITDVPFGQGRLVSKFDYCWFDLGAGAIWLSLSDDRDQLPDVVTEKEYEGTKTAKVPGGTVVTHTKPPLKCSAYLLSDRGFIIEVNVSDSTGTPQLCHFSRVLGRTVLKNLASEVPAHKWPASSLARTDLCKAVVEAKVLERLHLKGELELSDDRRKCSLPYSGEGDSFTDIKLAAGTNTTLGDASHPKPITVAGHKAELSESSTICRVLVQTGTNSELRSIHEKGKESVTAEAGPQQGVPCSKLTAALEPLIEKIA